MIAPLRQNRTTEALSDHSTDWDGENLLANLIFRTSQKTVRRMFSET